MAYLRQLVSKKKRRYQEDGFDLDLSCACPGLPPAAAPLLRCSALAAPVARALASLWPLLLLSWRCAGASPCVL